MIERQQWRKLGRIFAPDGSHPLMRNHATLPHADPLGGDLFRIYFSSRDQQQRSRTFSLVVDLRWPDRILDLESTPILDIGELGGFDDSGAMLTWITRLANGEQRFYYVGWNLRVTVPFQNALGAALAREGRVVQRFRGPMLDRTLDEPHFIGSACILREGERFRCWYLSCVEWAHTPARPTPRYHLKYTESADGLRWLRPGAVAVDLASPYEISIARPSVVKQAGTYRMWFSCRGEQYRIGYAESEDGLRWNRDDSAVDLAPSIQGWDSTAVAYPHVFEHHGSLYMLYNGNEYGRTGFGLAVLEQPLQPS